MSKTSSCLILLTTMALASCAVNPRDDRARDPNQRPEVRRYLPSVPFYSNGYVLPQFRARQYVVDDWQAYHLPEGPGPGFHWIRVGSEYALIRANDGAIARLVLNPP